MKTVTYFDMKLDIPDWAKFIAQDGDGNIYCYEYRPYRDGKLWDVAMGRTEHVGYTNPMSTLVEV